MPSADTPIHRIADRLAPAVRAEFLAAVAKLRGRVDIEAIADRLQTEGVDSVLALIGLAHFPRDLQPMVDTLISGFAAAGEATARQLADTLGVTVAFDLANPLAVHWARHYSAQLVTGLTDTTRAGVRTLVAHAIQAGQHPSVTAREIARTVGLNEQQAQAVATYRAELVDAERSAADVERLGDGYAADLTAYRATVIARTETIKSSSEGQLNLWQQAARDGLLNREKTSRIWITTEDDRTCDDCDAMDGQVVGFADAFDGGESYDDTMTPPLHQCCRCAVGLEL